MLTVLLAFVSLTAFHQDAAAGIIDSLYVSYMDAPRVTTANAIFAELFREEQTDSLIHFEESANPREVEIHVYNSLAVYFHSRKNYQSALDAGQRASAMLNLNNIELARQNQNLRSSGDLRLWLSISLGALLLAAVIILLIIWRKNTGMMRELNESKDIKSNFISHISQELREPMLTVKEAGLVLRLNPEGEDDDRHRIGDMIVKRCNGMINLLTRMNIKPTSSAPVMRSGDFIYFIRSTIEAHTQDAISHQIKLELKTPLKTLFINFAAEHIKHIIDLLIINSLKHTSPRGNITIEIPNPDKGHLTINVHDNGRGIVVENQPYIFSPGNDARTITENNKADTEAVINLTLVRMLILEIDGTISFASEPGKETTFTINLPLLPDKASEMEHDRAMPNIDEWLRQDNDKKGNAPMAFIVESDEDEAFLVARHLNETFNLRYARDGREALQNAQGLVPDIIITDVALPDMSSTEFIRQLRSNEILSHIPIIAMTNDTSEQERLKLIQAGVDTVLVKPISPAEMRLTTRHIVNSRTLLRERFGKTGTVKAPKPTDVQMSKSDSDFINKMVDVIHAQMSQGAIDMEQISTALSLSRKQLRSRMMDLTGLTPVAYVLQVRLNYAKRLMADSEMSLTQIANRCCFQNLSHFSKAFKQQFGMPPQQYRKNIDGISQAHS